MFEPSTVASQPALLLSPSTNQNGVPCWAPVTCSSILVLPLLVTSTFGVAAGRAAAWVTVVGSSPRGPSAIAVPPPSEPNTSPSTSTPVMVPAVVRTT